MALSAGLPGSKTTDGGLKKTGFQGPILAGKIKDSVGPTPVAGGVMCVQSTASITNQIVTTSAATLASRASFIYIPVTTGNLVGSTVAPPYEGVGTPLVWMDNLAKLAIWSSGAGAWLGQVVTSSGGTVGFTSTST